MKLGTKLFLFLFGAALAAVLVYQGYLLFHYRLHSDYQALLTESGVDYEPGAPFAGAADPDAPGGMLLAAQSEILKLFVNPQNAEAAVLDKRTGVTTYTNPPGADDDPVAGGVNKSILKSQLLIEFYDSNRLPGRYNSYDYSISLGEGQFELEAITNGFRCVYVVGDTSAPTGVVPVYISAERLEEFAARMSDQGKYVRFRYVESPAAPGFLELIEAARTGQATLRQLNSYFEEAGYTSADYEADMLASGVEGAAPISFTVPLEYVLDGDSLVARIPTGHIVEKGGGKIERIQLLRSFGAGGPDEDGYMVVPNGSGSLIHFNNGKSHAEDYAQYIYDQDLLLAEFVTLGNTETARMPYFGIQRQGQGILAEIQAGDTLALVTASIAGKLNSYNYVYPAFVLRGSNTLAMFGSTGNEAELPVVETNLTQVDIMVRYSFLDGAYEGYDGMARYARETLLERGALTPKSGGDIPFYMDLIGSAGGQRHFLSISYWGQYPMTTYAQASEMVDTLREAGISNQVINYQGWFNRGYYHDIQDKIKPVRQLGSKRELEDLSAKVEALGGKLYAETAFQRVSFASRNYNWSMETSRYYGGGYVAVLGRVNPTTYLNTAALEYPETLSDLMSPKFMGRHMDRFIKAIGKYDVTGISLRDFGDNLYSDRKRTEIISREDAKTIVLDNLDKLTETTGKPLLFSGGNSYIFGLSGDLINVPVSHNAIYMVDQEIPFYQMLIHGYIDYAGPAINLSDAYDETMLTLRLIEFGASPHFTFTAESSSELKYTGLNRLYGATFDNWNQIAARIYAQVNGALSQVSGSAVAGHKILDADLREITYDNGVSFLVNYGSADAVADGVTVGAKSFVVRGAGK